MVRTDSGSTGEIPFLHQLVLGSFRSANAVTDGFDYTSIDGAGATFAAGEASTVGAAIAYINDEIQADLAAEAANLTKARSRNGRRCRSRPGQLCPASNLVPPQRVISGGEGFPVQIPRGA